MTRCRCCEGQFERLADFAGLGLTPLCGRCADRSPKVLTDTLTERATTKRARRSGALDERVRTLLARVEQAEREHADLTAALRIALAERAALLAADADEGDE